MDKMHFSTIAKKERNKHHLTHAAQYKASGTPDSCASVIYMLFWKYYNSVYLELLTTPADIPEKTSIGTYSESHLLLSAKVMSQLIPHDLSASKLIKTSQQCSLRPKLMKSVIKIFPKPTCIRLMIYPHIRILQGK